MSKCISLFLLPLLLSVVTLPVYASAVHKWVDEQGITHYSDQLPENISNSVKQIDVSNTYRNSDSSDYQKDYYSVTNQWARMREERLERKQLQLEKAKLKAAQRSVEPQVVYVNQSDEYLSRPEYYPVYYRGYRHKYKHYNKHGGYAGKKLDGGHSKHASGHHHKRLNKNNSYRKHQGLTLTIR